MQSSASSYVAPTNRNTTPPVRSDTGTSVSSLGPELEPSIMVYLNKELKRIRLGPLVGVPSPNPLHVPELTMSDVRGSRSDYARRVSSKPSVAAVSIRVDERGDTPWVSIQITNPAGSGSDPSSGPDYDRDVSRVLVAIRDYLGWLAQFAEHVSKPDSEMTVTDFLHYPDRPTGMGLPFHPDECKTMCKCSADILWQTAVAVLGSVVSIVRPASRPGDRSVDLAKNLVDLDDVMASEVEALFHNSISSFRATTQPGHTTKWAKLNYQSPTGDRAVVLPYGHQMMLVNFLVVRIFMLETVYDLTKKCYENTVLARAEAAARSNVAEAPSLTLPSLTRSPSAAMLASIQPRSNNGSGFFNSLVRPHDDSSTEPSNH